MRNIFLQIVTVLALRQLVKANECSNGAIRMVNSTVTMANQNYVLGGGLQVCLNNTWTTVCSSKWEATDATVACRQLGLSYISKCGSSCYGNRVSPKGIFNLTCSETESQLLDCGHLMHQGCQQAAGFSCGASNISIDGIKTDTSSFEVTCDAVEVIPGDCPIGHSDEPDGACECSTRLSCQNLDSMLSTTTISVEKMEDSKGSLLSSVTTYTSVPETTSFFTDSTCSEGFCLNGGNCSHANINCSCTHEWMGNRCDIAICSPGFCKNGGTCALPNVNCTCPFFWHGQTCKHIVNNGLLALLILGPVLILCVAIGLSCLFLCVFKRSMKCNNTSNIVLKENLAYTLSQSYIQRTLNEAYGTVNRDVPNESLYEEVLDI